ncbi:sugar-transfer associated ATP-grasp domain-containing protein [Olsenella sp. HMSC062G07]|uniref:sugar-transfer associated ATP-grasp domain-containing protein n=1 Tax=Olsenella sp. HMSC062G07 TaxID=1739330 RepID=UPI0008A29109|nr:sugar-transfer associated ATP-grasp domain-containing protein [Olsenella sp. HMSC062G07]OFK24130.1 hypothetical protein HMPREF2826_08370 [Olsenella sp. HMSC062G07]
MAINGHVTNELGALLRDGFARPRAEEYLSILKEEIEPPKTSEKGTFEDGMFDPDYCAWAHSYGFFAKEAYVYDLDEANKDDYMSDYDYHRVWPLNAWQRIWINDKLTLKYMMQGSSLDAYLPDYYYYSTPQGPLPLYGSGARPGDEAFLDTLRAVGEFACKPCNGSRTVGFHKLAWHDGDYFIDNRPSSADGVISFLHANPNFVFTEFLHPSTQMAKISPVINNLRIMVFNPSGVEPVIGASYFRIAMDAGTDDSKSNYRYPANGDCGNYNVWFDWKTGHFGRGTILYANRVVDAPRSPDTGVLAEGVLDGWQEVCDMVLEMSERLNPLEYLGYDVCISDKGPKVIEINSHSGSKYLQYFQPFYKDDFLRGYFRDKVEAIEAMDEDQIRRRNALVR